MLDVTYQPFDPEAYVSGRFVKSFSLCLKKDELEPYLERHGLTDIDEEQWYPMQVWMDVFNDIHINDTEAMFDFVSIGLAIAEITDWSPEWEHWSLTDMFLNLDTIYREAHQGDAGGYTVEVHEPNYVCIIAHVPYPDDFVYGILYGFARRLTPAETTFTVRYDEEAPRHDHGSETTVFHVRWG